MAVTQGHSHADGHAHSGSVSGRATSGRRLTVVLVLSAGYMIAELVGGLWTGSLALLADAGHMLSDVGALGLSLFAMWVARRPPTPRKTYGYYRAEILAAVVNAATLIAVSIFIFVEAYRRFRDPPEVQGGVMFAIAAGGLAVNLAGAWVLHGGRDESLNMRGAWLHVLADALGSVGAIAAGVLIWAFDWHWADPVTSVLIGLLVAYSSWRLLAEAVGVLMEFAPRGIDVDRVRDAVLAVPGVVAMHDLHVWTITSGRVSLSAHVVSTSNGHQPALLKHIRERLREEFGITHVTIQLEPEEFEERRADF